MPRNSSGLGFSRSEKWLVLGVPALLLVVVGIGAFKTWLETTPTLALPALQVRPSRNGYDLYVRAASLIKRANPAIDENYDPSPPRTAKLRAQRYSLARRRAWLQANAAGFTVFDRAQRLPCLHPDRMWLFPNLRKFRELARFQTARANTYKLEGNWDKMTQTNLDTIEFGVNFPRGGSWLPRAVGAAVTAIGSFPLGEFNDVPDHLSGPQAQRAARRLEGLIARLAPYDQALETTRWEVLLELTRMGKQANWRAIALRQPTLLAPGPAEALTPPQQLQLHLTSKRQIFGNIDTNFDGAITDIQKPYSAPSDARLDNQHLDALSQLYTFPESLRSTKAAELTRLRIVLLQFALRAYRAEHDAYPTSLSQLAPSYLNRVPTDYYADDQPFHYKRIGKTYCLWSVGPDGINNGGEPIAPDYVGAPRPATVQPDSKGDWVADLNR